MFESRIFSKLTRRWQVELFEDKQQLIYHGPFRLVADLSGVDPIQQSALRNWRCPRVTELAPPRSSPARIAHGALVGVFPVQLASTERRARRSPPSESPRRRYLSMDLAETSVRR